MGAAKNRLIFRLTNWLTKPLKIAQNKDKRKESHFCNSLFLWCHQESNRGHKDFQSFALPTELWHHRYVLTGAKVGEFFEIASDYKEKIESGMKKIGEMENRWLLAIVFRG